MGIPRGIRCVALVLVAVAVGGCGGGGSAAAPPRLPHALGTELADQASAVEASLARGDECSAAAEAVRLQAMVAGAVAAGQVPAALRGPLARSVSRLADEVVCTPAPTKPAKPGKGHKPPGKGHGHDHGHDEHGGKD